MKNNTSIYKVLGTLVSTTLLVLTVGLSIISPANADDSKKAKKADLLYIGDQTDSGASDSTVKRFDATTGNFRGTFVTSNSGLLHGPRGIIFDHPGRLDVVNQNQDLDPLSGAVLQYNGETGAFLKAIVPATDTLSPKANPNAPYLPRGMVLWNHKVLFVAEFLSAPTTPTAPPGPGRLLAFTKNGKFLNELKPDSSILEPNLFHPRGVVVGPDGFLYVSNYPDPLNSPLGGDVLRVDPETGAFDKNIFIRDSGGIGQLNRPEGLVFSPDGRRLYITSFRADASDTDSIRIYKRTGDTGDFVGKIDLDQVDQPRAFAQALLFGPEGFLFVPISGNGPDTGAVRRYDVTNKSFNFANFVPPSAPVAPSTQGGPLGTPYYLTFGKTDPGTLAYNANADDD